MSALDATAPPPAVGKKTTYLPQLDGLRGIAILSVLIHHFGVHLPAWIDWGPIGVRLFFLLSGYLITLSVWKLGTPAEKGRSYWSGLGAFHLRRMVRLTPVLYLMIFVCALMGLLGYRDEAHPFGWLWHTAFLSNFYILYLDYWPGGASHLWSLSVQEQFYLLWPFVILVIPRKWLPWALGAMIGAALGYRIVLMENASVFYRWVMLPGVIDSFALGSLIACWKKSGARIPLASGKFGIALTVVALVSYVIARQLRYATFVEPWFGVTETFENVFLGWLMLRTIEGWKGVLGKVFENPALIYIGRISYGLYVFHVLVHIAIGPWIDHAGFTMENHIWIRTLLLIAISIGVATLSYRYIEMPLSTWARRRESAKKKAVSEPAASAVGS